MTLTYKWLFFVLFLIILDKGKELIDVENPRNSFNTSQSLRPHPTKSMNMLLGGRRKEGFGGGPNWGGGGEGFGGGGLVKGTN